MIGLGLGNGGSNNYWNYTNQQKAGYSPTLEGTVVQIAEVQSHKWDGKQQVPQFWSDGNPIISVQLTVLNAATGEDTLFEFPLGKNSQFVKAVVAAMPTCTNLEDLAGKYIRITSPAGVYNRQNPRPFYLEIAPGDHMELYRGTKHFGEQQQQAQQAAPMAAASPLGYQQQAQQQPGFQPTGFPQQQQPVQQGYGQAPVAAQPMAQPQPQVANSPFGAAPMAQQPTQQAPMQQPVQQPGSVYDESIPF